MSASNGNRRDDSASAKAGVVFVRFSSEERAWIAARADAELRSMAMVVRLIVREAIAREKAGSA